MIDGWCRGCNPDNGRCMQEGLKCKRCCFCGEPIERDEPTAPGRMIADVCAETDVGDLLRAIGAETVDDALDRVHEAGRRIESLAKSTRRRESTLRALVTIELSPLDRVRALVNGTLLVAYEADVEASGRVDVRRSSSETIVLGLRDLVRSWLLMKPDEASASESPR